MSKSFRQSNPATENSQHNTATSNANFRADPRRGTSDKAHMRPIQNPGIQEQEEQIEGKEEQCWQARAQGPRARSFRNSAFSSEDINFSRHEENESLLVRPLTDQSLDFSSCGSTFPSGRKDPTVENAFQLHTENPALVTSTSNRYSSLSIQSLLSQQDKPHNRIFFPISGNNQIQSHLDEIFKPSHELYSDSDTMSLQMSQDITKNQRKIFEDNWDEEEDEEDEYVQLDDGLVLKSSIRGRPAKRNRGNNSEIIGTNIQGFPWSHHSNNSIAASSPVALFSPSTTNASSTSIYTRANRQPYTRDAAGHYPCPHCSKVYQTSSSVSRHVKVVHNQIKPRCDTCGRTFADRRRRDGHHKNPKNEDCYADWLRGRYRHTQKNTQFESSRHLAEIIVGPGPVGASDSLSAPTTRQFNNEPDPASKRTWSPSNYDHTSLEATNPQVDYRYMGKIGSLACPDQPDSSTFDFQPIDASRHPNPSHTSFDGSPIYQNHGNYGSKKDKSEHNQRAAGSRAGREPFPFTFYQQPSVFSQSFLDSSRPVTYQTHSSGDSLKPLSHHNRLSSQGLSQGYGDLKRGWNDFVAPPQVNTSDVQQVQHSADSRSTQGFHQHVPMNSDTSPQGSLGFPSRVGHRLSGPSSDDNSDLSPPGDQGRQVNSENDETPFDWSPQAQTHMAATVPEATFYDLEFRSNFPFTSDSPAHESGTSSIVNIGRSHLSPMTPAGIPFEPTLCFNGGDLQLQTEFGLDTQSPVIDDNTNW
ncbi:hypothetical protein ONS96_004865 [Cadophora gregata f. sp. sojae]|nr:hypothetical protein ONS96_004865 [Cadophora gregata f. sp. sojae]